MLFNNLYFLKMYSYTNGQRCEISFSAFLFFLIFSSVLTASVKVCQVPRLALLRSSRCSVVIPEELKAVKLVAWCQHLSGILKGHS